MNSSIDWKRFLLPYELTVSGFIMKLGAIKKEHILKGENSPLEIVSGRVKNINSILEKANRLGISVAEIPEKIYDIAGLRIICKYESDVYKVFDLLKSRQDIEIENVKDYIKNPKSNGYRSLHVIARYNAEMSGGTTPVYVEFQIRTHAMHLWASIEHTLRYKYYYDIPQNVQEKLYNAALASVKLDNEIASIRDEMIKVKNARQRAEELEDDELDMFLDAYKS